MKIAIDFDSVLVHRRGIPTASDVWTDEPVDGAVDTLWWFLKNKIEFYIQTNRPNEDFERIRDWLVDWGFPSAYRILITREKQPNTTIFLDDRAIRFTNWNDFRKLIL